MIKLKSILKEGFAWERKADGSLPTLKDAIAVHEENKSKKTRWQDTDNDGKWYEPEDVSEELNELSDDEIDKRWNTPQQRWQRQFVTSDLESNKKLKNKTNDPATPQKISKFYQEKLAALEAERKQLMFDMEQEAEPEGGPIADYYGGELELLDKRIATVRKRMKS